MAIARVNSTTEESLRSFMPLTHEQLTTKLDLAARAFAAHGNAGFSSGAARMIRAAEILEMEKEIFVRIMALEMGKPIQAAIDEVVKSARYPPLRPVLAIMPRNYPLWQVIRFVAPALMVGNVGLLKHASNVPQSALAVEDVLLRAGFEEGSSKPC